MLLAASHPAAGAGANIGISGVAALAAAIVHVRAGRINWRLFAWMAPPSMLGAVAGGYLSGLLPDTALLVAIGAVLVYFGIDLLREKTATATPQRTDRRGPRHPRGGSHGRGRRRARRVRRPHPRLPADAGPSALRRGDPGAGRGHEPHRGGVRGIAGVIGHTPDGVDWNLLAIGSAASVPGALIGARLTGRLSERQLLRAIGAVLVVAGATTALQALV